MTALRFTCAFPQIATIHYGTVKYFKNGTLMYVSTIAPTVPMTFNVSLLTLGASVANAVLQIP